MTRRDTRAQMILNHKHTIELLVDHVEEVGFNFYTFRNVHAAQAESLLHDPADEGHLRKRSVRISRSVFTPLGVPGQRPIESTIREVARHLVPAAELHRFVETAFSELLNLHEGTIARYRRRPSEFRAWRDRRKAS